MSLTEKRYGFKGDSCWVEVLGETGLVNPKWSLLIDNSEMDSASETGEFSLETKLGNKQLKVDIN